jgi:Fe-S-cluster containining protein
MERLPVLDPATAACSECPAPCCAEHDVNVNGFDLVRLMRGLALSWPSLVNDIEHPHSFFVGFRLDSSSTHHHFYLRRRPDETCQFLLQLDGRWRRCGVHQLRPGACRAYPIRAAGDEVRLASHIVCPPPQRQLYQSACEAMRVVIDDDSAEDALWRRVLERWDLLARTVPRGQPLPMDAFVDWLLRLYDAVAPLRRGARGEWQLAAYALVDEFPLP